MILSSTSSHLSFFGPQIQLFSLQPFMPTIPSAWEALPHLPIHLRAGFCSSLELPLNITSPPFLKKTLPIFPKRE